MNRCRREWFASLGLASCLGILGVGSVLAPQSASSSPPDEARMAYKGSLLVQLRVANLDRAVVFYTKTLDFQQVLRSDTLKWAELSFGLDGVKIGLGEADGAQGSGTASLNIGVPDVDAARRLLESRGVTFLRDTIEISGKVKLADFVDPDGNKIRLAESLAGK